MLKFEVLAFISSVSVFIYLLIDYINSEFFSWFIFLFCIGFFVFVIFMSYRTFKMHESKPDYYYVKPNYKSSAFYIISALLFLLLNLFDFSLFFAVMGLIYLINFPLLSSRYILLGPDFLYSNITTKKKYTFKKLKSISITEQKKYLRLDFEKDSILIETFLEESKLEEIVEKVKLALSQLEPKQ